MVRSGGRFESIREIKFLETEPRITLSSLSCLVRTKSMEDG